MAILQLTQDILDHLKITHYFQAPSGGQKDVYIVTINKVKYALKIIKVNDERFVREIDICNEFKNNTGIPKIIKVDTFQGHPFILEEFIDGNDLNQISKDFLNDETKVLNLVLEIIDILTPIWNKNYVHRDIKPENIRMSQTGQVKVLDFGIARALDQESLTATGVQPLSWQFASPEQYQGNRDLISYRTDFFSLGILCYYLFTNKLPFGSDKITIEKQFHKKEIIFNSASTKINVFCNNVLRYDPYNRPRTIELLKKLLES